MEKGITSSKAKSVWLAAVISIVPLSITPFTNIDAINLIKLSMLSCFAIAAIAFLKRNDFQDKFSRFLVLVSILFVTSLFASSILSGIPFWIQFYGTQGRNAGLLALTSLVIIFMFTSLKLTNKDSSTIIGAIIFTGLFSIFYGVVQFLGKDPINWRNPYSPIVGTLGNPNFYSSHLGIVAGAALIFILYIQKLSFKGKKTLIIFVALECITALFLIRESLSIQGSLVFLLIVMAFVIITVLLRFRNKVLLGMAILSVFVGSIFMTMGFYGSGPLGQILYRESFIHRTNFWDAGIAMMAKNLFSGVGIDQFGDSYREYRSQNAVDLRGPEVSSDSAHNIAIDIGAGGGIIPFSLYLVIQITILVCGFRLMLKIEKGNILPIGIFSLWFGYQAQTLISINQIGVSIWGWILSGSIVAQFINLSNVKAKERVRGSGSNERINLMSFLLFGIVGLSISLPPLLKDSDFRNALKSQNGLEIITAAKSWPENAFYLNYASVLLNSNGYRDEAIELSRLAVKLNPRNYIGWKLIMQSTVEGSPERLEAIRVMRKLDPLNKEIPKR